MGTQQSRMSRRPSHSDPIPSRRRPLRRRALLWRVAFAIPLAAMLSGAGVGIWAAYHNSRSVLLWNMAALLLVFGFAIGVVCLGVWVASGGHLRPSDRL